MKREIMRKGLIIISGCPRSGTSAMSDIMHKLIGEKRMVYAKKPEPKKEPEFEETKAGACMKYLYNTEDNKKKRANRKTEIEKRKEKAKIMNPKGFYEDGRFAVLGIQWNRKWREELDGFLNDKISKCMKIVSQGLLPSDPRFFSKIIYMVRHPREVAKSQENLEGLLGNPDIEGVEQKNHSPKMYISVTAQAALFFVENPEIPVLFCQHSDMLKDPQKHIKAVAKFLGIPQKDAWEKAKDVIEQKLHRSAPQDIENDLWKTAEKVFQLFNKKDFQGVVDYMKSTGNKAMQQEAKQWMCPRFNSKVNKEMCALCTTDSNTMNNFKERATARLVSWHLEPCLFECGFDSSRDEKDLLTIEESIKQNFWIEAERSAKQKPQWVKKK